MDQKYYCIFILNNFMSNKSKIRVGLKKKDLCPYVDTAKKIHMDIHTIARP